MMGYRSALAATRSAGLVMLSAAACDHPTLTSLQFGFAGSAGSVRIDRLSSRPGVEFWTVRESPRTTSMLHDTFMACLVLGPADVKVQVIQRGGERTLGAGSLQLAEPGEVHHVTRVSAPRSSLQVWWQPEALHNAAAELGRPVPVSFAAPLCENPRVIEAFGAMARELSETREPFALENAVVAATSSLLLDGAVAASPVAQPTCFHPSVRRAVEFLRGTFRQKITLDELARETRLSKFHLVRCFRQAMGIPPHRYQNLLRLQAARRHLEQGTSVEETAALAGFADGPHLIRAFRQWLGVSPGSWARAARGFGVASIAPG